MNTEHFLQTPVLRGNPRNTELLTSLVTSDFETMFYKGNMDDEDEAEKGREKKRTCLEISQASMKEERPQHQPFAHLDGAGAEKVDHQPLQREVDGGAAGEVKMERKRFQKVRKRFARDIRGYMVGQQPHQPQPKLPAVEVVDKVEGCLDTARNNKMVVHSGAQTGRNLMTENLVRKRSPDLNVDGNNGIMTNDG